MKFPSFVLFAVLLPTTVFSVPIDEHVRSVSTSTLPLITLSKTSLLDREQQEISVQARNLEDANSHEADNDVPERDPQTTTTSDVARDVTTTKGYSPPGYHNYALVCAANRKDTDWCNRYFHLSCNSKGQVVQGDDAKFNLWCSENCLCLDLNPRPRYICYPDYSGQPYCAHAKPEAQA